jgi:hypothetical protein
MDLTTRGEGYMNVDLWNGVGKWFHQLRIVQTFGTGRYHEEESR